jgi:hypothetical protein
MDYEAFNHRSSLQFAFSRNPMGTDGIHADSVTHRNDEKSDGNYTQSNRHDAQDGFDRRQANCFRNNHG